jgi:hypothetical protein
MDIFVFFVLSESDLRTHDFFEYARAAFISETVVDKQ